MASHEIQIEVLNNAIGIPASSDGVMHLICHGTTVSTTFVIGTSYLLTKVADLDTLGVTAVNNATIHQHVTEFYAQAGDGAKLWVTPVANTTEYATYCASATFKTVIRGTYTADPLNGSKMVFLGYEIPAAGQSSTDFPADVTATIPILKAALAALFNEGYHLSGVIDGYNMSSTVTASTLGTVANKTAYNVSVCITGTKNNRVSSIGLLAAKFARITVGTSIGKVADGSIVASTMYLTNQTAITTLTPSDIVALGEKQFIFARTWLGRSGFYWNDGATCEAIEKALSNQEFNRIANRLSSNALAFFQEEIGKSLPVNSAGNLDSGYCGNKAQAFFNTYINPLIVSGDISNGQLIVTGPNFVSTRTLNFKLKILPAPALGSVEGTVEFVTTL